MLTDDGDKMVYCPNCGANNDTGSKYCAVCGKEFPSQNTGFDPYDTTRNDPRTNCNSNCNNTGYEEKSIALAVFLSVILPGLGVIYIGKTTEGFLMLILALLCLFSGFLLVFPWFACVVIWLVSLIYTAVKAGEYNSTLRSTGHPPW